MPNCAASRLLDRPSRSCQNATPHQASQQPLPWLRPAHGTASLPPQAAPQISSPASCRPPRPPYHVAPPLAGSPLRGLALPVPGPFAFGKPWADLSAFQAAAGHGPHLENIRPSIAYPTLPAADYLSENSYRPRPLDIRLDQAAAPAPLYSQCLPSSVPLVRHGANISRRRANAVSLADNPARRSHSQEMARIFERAAETRYSQNDSHPTGRRNKSSPARSGRRKLEYSPLPRVAPGRQMYLPRLRPHSQSPTRPSHSDLDPAVRHGLENPFSRSMGVQPLRPRRNAQQPGSKMTQVDVLPKSAAVYPRPSSHASADSGVALDLATKRVLQHDVASASLINADSALHSVPTSTQQAPPESPAVQQWLSEIDDFDPHCLQLNPKASTDETDPKTDRCPAHARTGSFLLGSMPRRVKLPENKSLAQDTTFGMTPPRRFKAAPIPAPLRKHLQFRKTGPAVFAIGPATSESDSDAEEPHPGSKCSGQLTDGILAPGDGMQESNKSPDEESRTSDQLHDSFPQVELSPNVTLRRKKETSKASPCHLVGGRSVERV
ncbi:hypothetical protein FH972_023901 [Carpinus fangiana]|uniref:Uncharacterized protein n=1 Tax=Carpinus fangiana TaxID=176857 RepID=A0A5N6KX02_9ROSI|nr:hypothetical protein FH972_023901 [Carpinus fangiana]